MNLSIYSFRYSTHFLDPRKNPTENDVNVWRTNEKIAPKNLDVEAALLILTKLAKELSELCAQERDESNNYLNKSTDDKKINGNLLRKGIERCAMFAHRPYLTCIGYVLHARSQFALIVIMNERLASNKVSTSHLSILNVMSTLGFFVKSCKPHFLSELLLTQIIPNELLHDLFEEMHTIMLLWKIPEKIPDLTKCTETGTSSLRTEPFPTHFVYENDEVEYICNQKMFRLMSPFHKNNVKNFRAEWNQGRPIVISNLSKHLRPYLWRPNQFSKLCGTQKCSLINCRHGEMIPNELVSQKLASASEMNMVKQ